MSDLIFTDHLRNDSKVNKRDRAKYALYIADTILNPDEIRIEYRENNPSKLYFLSRYLLKNKTFGVLAVFQQEDKVWTGWTGYQTESASYFESKRDKTVLIYRK